MVRKHLHDTLEALHDEIEKAEFVDRKDEELLRELMEDIRALLDASAERREEHESLGERLKDAVERFEESHPTLTANIQRVANALGRTAV